MLIRLNLRTGLILLAALAILVAGIAYAATVISQRQVPGSVILGNVQAAGPITLFSQIVPSSADLTVLAFGTGDIDSSGSFVTPLRKPFWAANSGSVPFNLILVATDVVVKRGGNTILSGDGILSLLMGPAGGTLLSSADHATLIVSGDPPVALEAGIEFLQKPQDLGLIEEDVITFTALFKALEVHIPGDVNGDGKANFIVGAPLDDPGGLDAAGSAYVFSGADGTLLYQRTGDSPDDRFGRSVSMAGDVNGDGRADFIVGAYLDDPAGGGNNAGSAYVFSGADGSLLYQRTGDTANDLFGHSVSGAGDVNGDGKADFIVGAHLDDPAGGGTDAGSAYVFSGSDGSLLYQVTGDTAGDIFGAHVSGAGDVNGDGKADFIVGAPFDDPAGGGNDAGSAYVFSGADGSLLYQRTGDTAGDIFGVIVSGAGDVNGDGKADFIVGAYHDDPAGGGTDAGSAYVFSGADGSLLYQRTGDTAGDLFGGYVSGAGDVNGDGRADFIVGAEEDDPVGGGTDAGSAYVFSGADGSLLYQRTGDSPSDFFGWSVSGAGDVNGDGRADFIVGAYQDDPAGGGTNAGSAYVFSGADGTFLYQVTGDSPEDWFGHFVGGGG